MAKILQDWLKTVDPIDRDKEHGIVVHFNTRMDIKAVEVVSVGIVNSSIVHPREVFRRAIAAGSVSIVLAHNHPSGICEPSYEDIAITQKLRSVGNIVGINFIDHIIFSDSGSYSFRRNGLLD